MPFSIKLHMVCSLSMNKLHILNHRNYDAKVTRITETPKKGFEWGEPDVWWKYDDDKTEYESLDSLIESHPEVKRFCNLCKAVEQGD